LFGRGSLAAQGEANPGLSQSLQPAPISATARVPPSLSASTTLEPRFTASSRQCLREIAVFAGPAGQPRAQVFVDEQLQPAAPQPRFSARLCDADPVDWACGPGSRRDHGPAGSAAGSRLPAPGGALPACAGTASPRNHRPGRSAAQLPQACCSNSPTNGHIPQEGRRLLGSSAQAGCHRGAASLVLQRFWDFVRSVRNWKSTTLQVPCATAGSGGQRRESCGKAAGRGVALPERSEALSVETPDVVWCELRPRRRGRRGRR
jgi:hypothetical protein